MDITRVIVEFACVVGCPGLARSAGLQIPVRSRGHYLGPVFFIGFGIGCSKAFGQKKNLFLLELIY